MTDKKRTVYWLLTAIIAVLSVLTVYLYSRIKSLEITVENNYDRAFFELVNYVDDMDTLLQKSMLITSPSQTSRLSSEIFRAASSAKACLGQLPVSDIQLEKTEKFLSQIGDYTYYLSQNVINSSEISDEEFQNLSELAKYSAILKNDLSKMQRSVYDGTIRFGTVSKKGKEYLSNSAYAASEDVLGDFENVEKEFHEYPSLIYDGPFSEHIENMKPILLENKKKISSDEGLSIASDFIGERGNGLSFSSESENTPIEAYSYSKSKNGRDIYISVSKKGGYPVYFLDNRSIGAQNLDFDEAIKKARKFLSDKGYNSMKESYYEKKDGTATINFAYTEQNVICYSDLIKVKVALDNGEIVGFEANGYIMNHHRREFDEAALSPAEAQSRISSRLSVSNTSVALIPKDSKKEVLCYEFKGNFNGKNFLIYINTKTGAEEEILMLIESPDGILTV